MSKLRRFRSVKKTPQTSTKGNVTLCFWKSGSFLSWFHINPPMAFLLEKTKCSLLEKLNHPITLKWFAYSLACAIFFILTSKNFFEISAPLTKLTQKDSPYKGGLLPPAAMAAFQVLKLALTSNYC